MDYIKAITNQLTAASGLAEAYKQTLVCIFEADNMPHPDDPTLFYYKKWYREEHEHDFEEGYLESFWSGDTHYRLYNEGLEISAPDGTSFYVSQRLGEIFKEERPAFFTWYRATKYMEQRKV